MRTISFLLTLVSLLFHQTVFSYTVVLKSGKSVEGTRIGEDAYTLQIKDSHGVLLSFRKSTLDLATMERINQNIPFEKPEPPSQTFRWGETEPPAPTLVELALATRKNQRNSPKVQMKDLQQLPDLSILGSEEPLIAGNPPSDLNESQWRSQSRSFRDEVDGIRQSKRAAEDACKKSRDRSMIELVKPRRGTITIVDPSEEPPDCERAKKLGQQLESAQQRYEEFQDRARQSGVPWQWID